MAALRKMAKLWPAVGFFTRQRSSCQSVSRTQCRRFSMPQWLRHIRSSRSGPARWGEMLVMANCSSRTVFPSRRVVRSSRQICFKLGHESCETIRELASRCRTTLRPCSLLVVLAERTCSARLRRAVGGKSRQEFAGDRLFEFFLVVFDDDQIVAARIDDFPTNIGLSEHRVGRDDASFQCQRS